VNQSPAKETLLQSGDVIRLGQKTQLRFESHEEATLPMSHRRGGFFHKLAWIAASIALLAEVSYLLFIGIWNYDRKLFQTGPLKQAIEMAPPVERPKVIAPSAEEIRNAAAAREKLNELQSLAEMSTQTATQAPPLTSTGVVSVTGVDTGRVTMVTPPVEPVAVVTPPPATPVAPVQPVVTTPPPPPPEPVAPALPPPTPTQPIPPPVSPPAAGTQTSIPMDIDLAPLAPITKADAALAAPTRAVLASAHQVDRTSLPRRIVIARCDLKTLPTQNGIEEMRELYVTLWAQDPAVRRIPGEDVTLVAHFFDAGAKTGAIRLSDARYPRRIMSVEGGVPSKPGIKVVFTSVVPDGFRRAEAESAGEKRVFLGYAVRVFYRGELQDVFAMPASLFTEPVGE
jgi:hypothetical protein